jgi:signal transduction histidine kinase
MTHPEATNQDITDNQQMDETLTKLLNLSRALVATRDLDTALSLAVDSAVEVVPAADRCTLQWLEEDGDTLLTVAFSDSADIPRDVPPFRKGEGVAGYALATRQLVNVPDVLADERYVPGDPTVHFRSLLVAPLFIQDRLLGTLSLTSKRVNAFSTIDEAVIGLVADQVAVALDNAHAFTARRQAEEALRRYAERLKTRLEIDQSILAARLPETIAVAAIHRIRQLIPCQRVLVMAVAESGRIAMLAAESASEIEPVGDIAIYREMLRERTLNSGWVHGVENLGASSPHSPLQESLYAQGVCSYVAAPLFIQGELVGTLNLESTRPRAFTPDHIAIASEVAASLAIAIRQARLYEQAQQEITERRQAEAMLRQYAADLESRNAELDAFAHTVAHDLRNPVTFITGYAQVLEHKYQELPDETVQQFLRSIAQGGRKLGTIVDELLLLSSVRAKQEIEIHPLEMGHIVAEARGRLLHLIEEEQGQIILPDGWPVALGHGPWIEAVWANYISNALKYGGQPPHVELGATTEPDGWVRFWVRDNGPGLAPQEQARLFTPFERLHHERAEGHGLGLSIVQRIVKKLGGQVGVESEGVPGQGSTFFFTLPGLHADGV